MELRVIFVVNFVRIKAEVIDIMFPCDKINSGGKCELLLMVRTAIKIGLIMLSDTDRVINYTISNDRWLSLHQFN